MYRLKVESAAVVWLVARTKACAAPMGDKVVWADLGAAETALTEAVVGMLDEEAEEARLAARPKLFVVYGKMHLWDHEEQACTLDEAIFEAWCAHDNGSWYPMGVRTLAGEPVFNKEQLYAKVYERDT